MATPDPYDGGPQRFHLGEGDLEPSLTTTLYWSDQSLVTDLAVATSVEFSMWANPRAGNPKVDLAAMTIVDADNAVVKYAWAPGDTDTPGTYQGRICVTFPGNRVESFPNDGFLKIIISANGASEEQVTPPEIVDGTVEAAGEVSGPFTDLVVRTVHSGSSHAQIATAAAEALTDHESEDSHHQYARADGTRGLYEPAWNIADGQFADLVGDQAAFEAAITAAVTAGGGVVAVPAGTYTLLNLEPAGVTIRGMGRGLTILRLDTAAIDGDFVITSDSGTAADGFAMENLTVDGNKAHWGANDNTNVGCVSLAAGTVTNVRFRNVEIRNGKSAGLILGPAAGSVLDNVDSHGHGYTSGTGIHIAAVGVQIASNDAQVRGGRSYSNSSHGYLLTGAVTGPRVQGAYAFLNGGDGFRAAAGTTLAAFNLCVSRLNTGNGFFVGAATYPTLTDVTADSNGLGGIVFSAVTGGTLVGSWSGRNNTSVTGSVDEVTLANTSTGCTVVGNTLVPVNAEYAIREATSADVGNVVVDNATPAGTVGTVLLFSAAMLTGAGAPTGTVAAGPGSTWRRTNGGVGSSFYVKENTGTAGWRGL